jgi:DNA-directed RNA polymerase specialized sigma subunit
LSNMVEFSMSTPFSEKKTLFPEEYKVWKQDPSGENMSSLMKKMNHTIDKTLKTYGAPELRTRAKILATQAFNTYDPNKGMALNTYLHQQLQALQREKARRGQVVHIPENVRLTKNKIFQATKAFESENDREPNMEELADLTGIPKSAISRSYTYKATSAQGSSQSDTGEDLYSRPRDFDRVWTDYVYFDLDPRDKKIFEMTTGYGGASIYSKGEIARKLKLSPSAVSQRINKIVTKLEENVDAS